MKSREAMGAGGDLDLERRRLRLDEVEDVVVLFDADDEDEDPDDDTSLAADIKAALARHRIDDKKVSVFLAVPVLEAWILAGTDEQPEVPDAKQRLRKLLGRRSPDELADAVKSLDLEKARRRSPSLDAFVAGLESLRPSAA